MLEVTSLSKSLTVTRLVYFVKMPNRTYITKVEKSMPRLKPMKDRITIFVCANASGDRKIKPMVIYHSENPRIFKRNIVIIMLCYVYYIISYHRLLI